MWAFARQRERSSLRAAVHCDSISTLPLIPVLQCRKLDHGQVLGDATNPRVTGF